MAFDNLTVVEGLQLSVSADPTSGPVPLEIRFASATHGGIGPYGHAWTFGDSETSAQANPTHVYRHPGNYTAALNVTDAEGRTITRAVEIIVGEEAMPWLTYGAMASVVGAGIGGLVWFWRRHSRRPPKSTERTA